MMQNEPLDKKEDSNVFRFISDLRKEALYISSEKSLLRNLNEKIRAKTEELVKSSWINTKKRLILIQTESSVNTVQDLLCLECSEFIEAKNFIGFQNASKLGALLQILRTQPEQLAQCLIVGEQLNEEQVQFPLLQSVVSGLYASLIFSEDVNLMVHLLLELAKYQLFRNEKPQRALKQRSNSFAHLYYIFHEVLLSAKYFLSATLEVPVLRLLTIDYYLDIDPDKSNIRYQQEENVQLMFKNLNDYRKNVLKELAKITNLFITSLQENTLNFPKPLSWLVSQIEKCVLKSFDEKEANAVITELLFNMFICPAILNPEQYGICAQITQVSRHNLMQIGQLIQSLALIKYETPEVKLKDLYSSINKEVVLLFINEILTQVKYLKAPSIDTSPFICRETALFTEQEIKNLVSFLNKVHNEVKQNENFEKHSLFNDSIVRQIASLSLYPVDNSTKYNKPYTNGFAENNFKKSSSLLSLVTKNNVKTSEDTQNTSNVPNVLLFTIRTDNFEPVGMLSERIIMEQNASSSKSEITYPEVASEVEIEIQKNMESNEVKINFSNYQDEGSIGNTSDNLEAISEGASNHSVASSLEMENEDQNDNYSDMVSANVSGRGSPNISGRDTPSSQVNENEDRALAEPRLNADPNAEVPPPAQQQSAAQLSRQIRSEIDDKFCKFEIKLPGPGRDETTSLYSETWSTDVLASDNETIDASESRNENRCSIIDQAITEAPLNNILDLSETQSESAWSTDVMMSDTDRLTEIDQDDIGSIAQSDDAHSVAPSDDTRSETDENVTTPGSRRMSSSSTSFMNHVMSASSSSSIVKIERGSSIRRDSNANVTSFKASTHSVSSQETSSSGFHDQISNFSSSTLTFQEHKSAFNSATSNSFTLVSGIQKNINKSLDQQKEQNLQAGPSGLNKRHSIDVDAGINPYLKQSKPWTKYERSNEILLSNCSLNSSSSGSSSNSFENKNPVQENSSVTNGAAAKWEKKWIIDSSQNSLNVISTPSESTSELSVLSVTNIIDPISLIDGKKTGYSEANRSSKASTGAIPKSISFDVTADKGDKYADDDQRSKRGGFFGKLRIGFTRNRRVKSFRTPDEYKLENNEEYSGGGRKSQVSPLKTNNNLDLSDDILAKYRNKSFIENSPTKSNNDTAKRKRHTSESTVISSDGRNSFKDIKNKLRMVLSASTVSVPEDVKVSSMPIRNMLEMVLRMELGKARKMKQSYNVARLSEAIKCVHLLDDKMCMKLIKNLKDDLSRRSVYIEYLNCSRKDLLFSVSFLDGLHEQVSYEKTQWEEYLAIVYVQDFFQTKEEEINNFCEEFKQLSLSDEKCDILNNFHSKLYRDMKGSGVWKDALRGRKQAIKTALQRCIISKVYENALYPNGDGDKHRDQVLHEHIEKLSGVITPEHKYLMIQKIYLRECPWLPAQEALKAMSAYRTPKDKLNCVVQGAKCVMDLLSMAQNGSTTADDFTPVLVFVIIKSNPPDLLSTIQFVNSFYGNEICGEEQYWWTQFCAAVEFIKTMDYSD